VNDELTRFLKTLAVMAVVALIVSGCHDGDTSPDVPQADLVAKNWPAMEQSDEFKAAIARFEQCMKGLGYPSVDTREGVLLKDGTVFKPEPGQSYPYTGAYLEYRVDTERCSSSSGVDAVRQQFGASDPTPNTNFIKARNRYGTQQAACLARKGWNMPEPVTVKGAMIWDVQLSSQEEQDAYARDQIACNMELFGSPGFPN
jgi:hypothetical protein